MTGDRHPSTTRGWHRQPPSLTFPRRNCTSATSRLLSREHRRASDSLMRSSANFPGKNASSQRTSSRRKGELLVQPDLAATIARMQKDGWQEFYNGKTAKLIAADMAAHGGWITEEDMRNYHAEIHDPIHLNY